MRHPVIFPGRQGLPRTSNVPWSAAAEKQQRNFVLADVVGMLAFLGFAIWAFIEGEWPSATFLLFAAFAAFLLLRHDRRVFFAMRLNKPRSLEGLTKWTEHRAPQIPDPDAYLFFCSCGRLVDLLHAPYFEATRRWSVVCECGRGHFMAYPPDGPAAPHPMRLH